MVRSSERFCWWPAALQISYNKPGNLQLIGGSIGSRVVVGNGTTVSDVGVRWQNGAGIVQAEGTAGAQTFGLQERREAQALRSEVAALRGETAALRDEVAALREAVRGRAV